MRQRKNQSTPTEWENFKTHNRNAKLSWGFRMEKLLSCFQLIDQLRKKEPVKGLNSARRPFTMPA